ncbi:MAG TPA: SAM-dependent chlorinase/fluorinase [Gemmatimonadales bacterium]|jgi:S-adenosylmethionine hydrolase
MPIITLLTDFGTSDAYVAEVKAVLLSRVPGATLVDVTHHVSPGDIRMGQYFLARAWPRFPLGSVHLAVIDPGVGTARRALAAEVGGQAFVSPDNGLLSVLPGDARFVSLPVLRDAAPTFHARDVFAPAAARLAAGARLEELGPALTDPLRDPFPVPRVDGGTLVGEVVYVDRFGNLISNIPCDPVGRTSAVTVAGEVVGSLRRTFGDVAKGELVAYCGSGGTVEVAVRDGSAAEQIGAGVGALVTAQLAGR